MIVNFSVNGTSFLQNGSISPNISKVDFLNHIANLQRLIMISKSFDANERLSSEHQTDYEILLQLPNKKQYRYVLNISDTSVLKEELYLLGENGRSLFIRDENKVESELLNHKSLRKNQLWFSRFGYFYKEMKDVHSFFDKDLIIYTADLTGKLNKKIRNIFDTMQYQMKTDIAYVTRIFLGEIGEGIMSVDDKLEINFKLFNGANQIGTYGMGVEVQSTGIKILLDFLPIFFLSQIKKGTLICVCVNDYVHSNLTDFLMEISKEHELQFIVI